MWKEMKRKLSCVAAAVLCVSGVLALAEARQVSAAEQQGKVIITLKEMEAENSAREGVEFYLWKVGTASESEAPQFDEKWGISEYPRDSASLDEAAEQISDQIEETPERTGKTDGSGQLVFEDLEQGIYLIQVAEDNPYGKISPFLIWLPYWEEVDGELSDPLYEVTAEPKASPWPEEPKAQIAQEGDNVKTGDSEEPAVWVALAMGAVLAAGIMITGRKRAEGK